MNINLKTLSPTECEKLTELNVMEFKDKTVENILKLRNLECLKVTLSPLRELKGLGRLKKLRKISFTLLRKLEDLTELGELPALEALAFDACNKIRLETFQSMGALKALSLNDMPKLRTIKFLSKMLNLEKLSIWGSSKIQDGDLAVLGGLKKLKELKIAMRKNYSKLPDNEVIVKALEQSKRTSEELWKKYREQHPEKN